MITKKQQQIIDDLKKEFEVLNKKDNKKLDIISMTKNQVNEHDKIVNETKIKNRALHETSKNFLDGVAKKLEKFCKEFNIKVTKSYDGCGYGTTSLYLNAEFEVHQWEKVHATLCIGVHTKATEVAKGVHEYSFSKVRVGYPTYKEDAIDFDVNQILILVSEWYTTYKQKQQNKVAALSY